MGFPAVFRPLSLMLVLSHVLCGYVEHMDIRNVCEKSWALVYANSAEGDPWLGNKGKLMDDITHGKDVKVTLLNFMETYQIRVDNVNKRKNEVCAESLNHLANNGTHVLDQSPRRFMLVCTSGHVSTLEEDGFITETQQAMYWYTKELSEKGNPVFSNFIDGSPARGSLQNLWEAARTMALRGVMRDRAYAFPMHNVAVDSTTGVVTGQNVRHISQMTQGPRIKFFTEPYLWFSSWNSNGVRDNARWSLGNTHTARGHNSDWVSLDWYADTCWRPIYTHGKHGDSIFGTVEELIEKVRAGHRVRLTIDEVTYEASNVRVSGQTVAAQLLDAVVRKGWTGSLKYRIKDDTAYHWVVAHTSGIVYSYEYKTGSPERKGPKEPNDRKSITWSVDTRPWRVVLKTEGLGMMSVGNPIILREAIEQGASIRLNLAMDDKGGDFLTEPDNIRIDETMEVVYAQAMNHVSDSKAASVDEFKLQNVAFFWYLLISSEGTVRMSAWFVGKNMRKYDKEAPSAVITWYANF